MVAFGDVRWYSQQGLDVMIEGTTRMEQNSDGQTNGWENQISTRLVKRDPSKQIRAHWSRCPADEVTYIRSLEGREYAKT